MPTYSYECKTCDHVTEVFHAISAKRRVKCEKCGGPCRRLIGTGAAIIFKGSGFYETDYKSKSDKPAETASSGNSSSGDSSSNGDSSGEKKSSDKKSSSTKSDKKATSEKN